MSRAPLWGSVAWLASLLIALAVFSPTAFLALSAVVLTLIVVSATVAACGTVAAYVIAWIESQ